MSHQLKMTAVELHLLAERLQRDATMGESVRVALHRNWGRLDAGFISYARVNLDAAAELEQRELYALSAMCDQLAVAARNSAERLTRADRDAARLFGPAPTLPVPIGRGPFLTSPVGRSVPISAQQPRKPLDPYPNRPDPTLIDRIDDIIKTWLDGLLPADKPGIETLRVKVDAKVLAELLGIPASASGEGILAIRRLENGAIEVTLADAAALALETDIELVQLQAGVKGVATNTYLFNPAKTGDMAALGLLLGSNAVSKTGIGGVVPLALTGFALSQAPALDWRDNLRTATVEGGIAARAKLELTGSAAGKLDADFLVGVGTQRDAQGRPYPITTLRSKTGVRLNTGALFTVTGALDAQTLVTVHNDTPPRTVVQVRMRAQGGGGISLAAGNNGLKGAALNGDEIIATIDVQGDPRQVLSGIAAGTLDPAAWHGAGLTATATFQTVHVENAAIEASASVPLVISGRADVTIGREVRGPLDSIELLRATP